MAMQNPLELRGDDFSAAQIERWRELTDEFHRTQPHHPYEYAALDARHLFSPLLGRRFGCCLALGCGTAEELLPLAPSVDRFMAIEPIESFWPGDIAGKPIACMQPLSSGDLAVPAGSVDLVVALDVLHHIANVSHVLGEIGRVLTPGGVLAVREPISSMGDWSQPRPGMTPCERGLPLEWFAAAAPRAGLKIVRQRLCLFAPLLRVLGLLGIRPPLDRPPFVLLDSVLCESLRWNVRYRRTTGLHKLAASSAAWLLEKPRS